MYVDMVIGYGGIFESNVLDTIVTMCTGLGMRLAHVYAPCPQAIEDGTLEEVEEVAKKRKKKRKLDIGEDPTKVSYCCNLAS